MMNLRWHRMRYFPFLLAATVFGCAWVGQGQVIPAKAPPNLQVAKPPDKPPDKSFRWEGA